MYKYSGCSKRNGGWSVMFWVKWYAQWLAQMGLQNKGFCLRKDENILDTCDDAYDTSFT